MQTAQTRSAFSLFKSYVNVKRIVIRKLNKEERLCSSEGIDDRITKVAVEYVVYCLRVRSGFSAAEAVGTARMTADEIVAFKRRVKSVKHSFVY